VILALAAIAGIAYYVGTPPPLPTVQSTATSCPQGAPQVVIPQGIGTNSDIHFQPQTLTVVIGVNNTIGWDDLDTTLPHVVSSVSVPPNSVQWDLNMTGGNSYCVTLPTPGTYSYELRLPAVVGGIIQVKSAT
jgi:plastocyanin